MGVFDNLDQVDEGYDNSKYFEEGKYLVDLGLVTFKQGTKGGSFIIETTVLAAVSVKEGAPEAGDAASHVWNLGQYPDMARAKWIRFLMGATGKGQKDLTGPQWADLSEKIVAQGAMKGTKMFLEVVQEDRPGKHPLKHHNWKRQAVAQDFADFGLQSA